MLRDALAMQETDELRAVADHLRLGLRPEAPRHVLEASLERYLTSADGVSTAYAALPLLARDALDVLLSQGGALPVRFIERDYGVIYRHSTVPFSSKFRAPDPTPATLLYRSGFVHPIYGKIGHWQGEILYVAEDTAQHLPRAGKPPIEDILQPVADPPRRAVQGDLIRDIGLLLCYLQRETVRAVRGDQIPKRDIVRLNAEMSLQEDLTDVRTEADTSWLLFVHRLAVAIGLVQSTGGIISLTEIAPGWLAAPYEQQARDAWSAYLADEDWNEDQPVRDAEYGDPYYSGRDLPQARTRVITVLKHCLPQRWYSLSSLGRALQLHDPFFLRRRGGSLASLYWDSSLFYGSWAAVEAQFIAFMVCRSLTMFNVVEVGGPATENRCAVFRLTDHGAALTGLVRATIESPAVAPIVVQPNFEIVVPRETAPYTLFTLQQTTELQKRDRASIYRITPHSIWRHLQEGRDAEGVIAFLDQAAQRPLPQNVAYSIREWAGRFGEVTLERADLVRTTSATLMAELRANKKLALPVEEELSSSVATLHDADLPALLDALRKAGYWPRAASGVPRVASAKDAARTIPIAADDLAHLLAGALFLWRMAQDGGWNSPVSERMVRALLPRLSPALAKQARRLADEAIMRYLTSLSVDDNDVDLHGDAGPLTPST